MEVKVFCQCGSKYKFDVEPVNERMPWPVNCPTCGADGTPAANQIIAQTLAANPPAPAPAPPPAPMYAAAPAPVAAPAAAAPPPTPAPGGLRINKPAAPPPSAAPPTIGGAPPPPPGGPPRFTPATARPIARPKPSGESMWAKIGGGAFGAIVVGLIAFRWIYRIYRLGHAIAGVGSGETAQLASQLKEIAEMNLMADNGVVLYVKHDDFREVARDCAAYWKDKQHRNFSIVNPDKQQGNGSEYQVYPAHNGYVTIMSGLEWKDPMFESTAQHLSEKYSTMVFDEKDVDFTGAFVFGVYDGGSNVFHVRTIDVKDGGDKTKCENVEWAKAHGYKPNSHGNEYFDILDANRLTKEFGMKFWDQKDGTTPTNYIVVTAVGN